MGLLKFTTCSFLPIFFEFVFFQYVSCNCLIPYEEFPDGKIIIYKTPNDTNVTYVEHLDYLLFKCFPEYNLFGHDFTQCVNDEWKYEVPFCGKMKCFRPPTVENAKYAIIDVDVDGNAKLNSTAVYTCDKGYELTDTEISTLHCNINKTSKIVKWRGEVPSCKEIVSCPDPGVSKFGSRSGLCCVSGNYLTFYCNDGYELVGKEEIHCMLSGTWSSSRPLCKLAVEDHCELPPHIPHGSVIGHNVGDYFAPLEEAQVVCEPRYKCKGPQFVFCDEDGNWESDFGECTEIFCDPPPPLANGTILELESMNLTSFPYNFEVTYVCDKGYRLIGDSWRVCGKRGWSRKVPHCEITQCPDPGKPERGIRLGDNYTIGSSVHFNCSERYDLLGSIQRYCMPNGQWTGELARCDLPSNYCPNPGIPIKGSKYSTDYDLGSKIEFSCQDGYIQIGSEVRECLSDHTWSGTETKCIGPHDFDNDAVIGDRLMTKISLIAEEQRMELRKYREIEENHVKCGFSKRKERDSSCYPRRIILYFVFDNSRSVGAQNFAKSIEFAKAIVRKVGISENGARAGAVTFLSGIQNEFLPLHHNTTESVLDALDRINYTDRARDDISAIHSIRNQYILVGAWLGATNVKSVMFLLTDGKANIRREYAEFLKRQGVEIHTIGITGNTRKKFLYDIASKSKNDIGEEYSNVYILQNYATLSWLVQEITNGTVDYSRCGLGLENVGNMQSRRRIVEGKTSKQSWPWTANLYMQSKESIEPKHEFKCGGSIIHQSFILTTAHCLFESLFRDPVLRDENGILVKLGLIDAENESYIQESEVVRMFLHPKYQPGNFFDYDIALLQLKTSSEFNSFIRPICLPPKDLPEDTIFYSPNSEAWGNGFGHDKREFKNIFVKRNTQHLKEIYLPIQTKERCIESLTSRGVNASFFTDRMFCAGDGKGEQDTCHEDSGRPLIQSLMNSKGYVYWTQVGIVSWGIGCGLQDTYGYYTHVQKLRSWIDETIENALKG